MTPANRLRFRILAVLSSGAFLFPFASCSGSSESTAALTPSSTMCSGGQSAVTCWSPGETHFNVGNVPPDAMVMTPTPEFDANRCQVQAQVSDGCCNGAVTGPELKDGKCCYGFCTGACCGRPLFVAGEALVAGVIRRDDWLDPTVLASIATTADAAERAHLADAWLEDARMEHASIASFARFVLDLLAFGAPADLVEQASKAMDDEIRHARACFAIATAYSGVARGPGPLPLAGVIPSATLAEAASAAFREGCVGETIAALTLSRQASTARSPVLRSLLEAIADDEARHAELAWKFVRWALASGDADVRVAIADALRSAGSHVGPASSIAAAREHGRLAPGDFEQVRLEAWQKVIGPCARALDRAA
ncbi:MAG TPA: ferritin-like domain-containing protein [Polyangiaceae bacterium]|nr:ferritin-like domain-containing protein [Polyangiaceae bacterium]